MGEGCGQRRERKGVPTQCAEMCLGDTHRGERLTQPRYDPKVSDLTTKQPLGCRWGGPTCLLSLSPVPAGAQHFVSTVLKDHEREEMSF